MIKVDEIIVNIKLIDGINTCTNCKSYELSWYGSIWRLEENNLIRLNEDQGWGGYLIAVAPYSMCLSDKALSYYSRWWYNRFMGIKSYQRNLNSALLTTLVSELPLHLT